MGNFRRHNAYCIGCGKKKLTILGTIVAGRLCIQKFPLVTDADSSPRSYTRREIHPRLSASREIILSSTASGHPTRRGNQDRTLLQQGCLQNPVMESGSGSFWLHICGIFSTQKLGLSGSALWH
jgi:hypothetical protein